MIAKIISLILGLSIMIYADYACCSFKSFWFYECLWYFGLLITIIYASSIVVRLNNKKV